MKVEKALIDDVRALVDLGAQMHNESTYAPYSFSESKIEALLHAGIHEFGGVFLRIVRHNDEIIGGMLGLVSNFWFSDEDTIANDLALFVRPDKRGVIASKLLIGEFRQWAREQGAKELALSITTGVHPERTARLFEHCGVPQIGTVHRVEV